MGKRGRKEKNTHQCSTDTLGPRTVNVFGIFCTSVGLKAILRIELLYLYICTYIYVLPIAILFLFYILGPARKSKRLLETRKFVVQENR